MNQKVKGAMAVAVALALTLTLTTPASALGNKTGNCSPSSTFNGYSGQTNPSQTWTIYGDVCGRLGVRVFYQTYSGSPIYYTAWSYGYNSVYRNSPGNTVLGGNHLAERGALSNVQISS